MRNIQLLILAAIAMVALGTSTAWYWPILPPIPLSWPTPTPTATSTWTEDWSGVVAARWHGITGGLECAQVETSSLPVGNKLILDCESGALQSYQTWDRRYNITVSGSFRCAEGSPNSYYWCGVAILGQDDPSCQYGEIVLEKESLQDQRGSLTNCSWRSYGTVTAGAWHTYTVQWQAYNRRYVYYMDGLYKGTVSASLTVDPRIDILTVAVAPGESCTCYAHGEYGAITVTGVVK